MATRRVFRTTITCPGITDFGPAGNQCRVIGRTVTFEKASSSDVNIALDGVVLGQLYAVGHQVASAIDRGQSFKAVIEKANPVYSEHNTYPHRWTPVGAEIRIKVEYLLEKGQPAIQMSRSLFTRIAGVTFEGRQQIIERCSNGENLVLVRDPDNRFDRGAVKVMRLNGEQLGFVPRSVSRCGDPSGLAFKMDNLDVDSKYHCRVNYIRGDQIKGVLIEITGDNANMEITEVSELTTITCDTARTTLDQKPDLVWIAIIVIIIVGYILWAAFK